MAEIPEKESRGIAMPTIGLWPHEGPIFDVNPDQPTVYLDEQGAVVRVARGTLRLHLPTWELATWTDNPRVAGDFFRDALKEKSRALLAKAPGSQLLIVLRCGLILMDAIETHCWFTNLGMAATYGMEPELLPPFETATFGDLPETIDLKDPAFGAIMSLVSDRLFGKIKRSQERMEQ